MKSTTLKNWLLDLNNYYLNKGMVGETITICSEKNNSIAIRDDEGILIPDVFLYGDGILKQLVRDLILQLECLPRSVHSVSFIVLNPLLFGTLKVISTPSKVEKGSVCLSLVEV